MPKRVKFGHHYYYIVLPDELKDNKFRGKNVVLEGVVENKPTIEFLPPDKAEKFGKNVANFYKELVAAGMDPDKAFELTKEYMESMNIVKTLIVALMKEKWAK